MRSGYGSGRSGIDDTLQGELMAIVEAAEPAPADRMNALEFFQYVQTLGPGSPNESNLMIRHMRDTRNDPAHADDPEGD